MSEARTADPLRRLPETAEGLVNLFCRPGAASSWPAEKRQDGAAFRGGSMPLLDGYTVMERMPRAWQPLDEVGSWPYSIFWANPHELAVASYCEGDFGVWVADDQEAFERLLERIRREEPADA